MNDNVFRISKIKIINKTGVNLFTKYNKMHRERHAVHDLTERISYNQNHRSIKKTGSHGKKDA